MRAMKRMGAAVMLSALAAIAGAQLFPPRPEGTFVADGAHLIGAADRQEITRLSKELLGRQGAPIVVATVESLDSVQAKPLGIEGYARQMFDSWHIGSAATNRGILLVVAKADHKARIEMGGDWQHVFDSQTHQVMAGTLVPAFKRGEYSTGIREGVAKLERMALAGLPASLPAENIFPTSAGADMAESPSNGGAGLLIFLALIGTPILLFYAFQQNLRRPYFRRPPRMWDPGNSPSNSYSQTNVWIDNSTSSDSGWVGGFDSGSSSSCDSGSSSGFDSGSGGGGGDTGSW